MNMKKIVITIETTNAAFEDNPQEVTRILNGIAEKLEDNQTGDPILVRDINGNSVGRVETYML